MTVRVLGPGDRALVADLVRIVNDAYAASEAGLWVDGTARTGETEIAAAIESGGMLAAFAGGHLVGCGLLRALDDATGDLGFVAAAPDAWGTGVGRAIVHAAEDLARARGMTTMQLELLVPRDDVQAAKERLRAWYARLGYEITRVATFEEIATHAASELATPCQFLVFQRDLTPR